VYLAINGVSVQVPSGKSLDIVLDIDEPGEDIGPITITLLGGELTVHAHTDGGGPALRIQSEGGRLVLKGKQNALSIHGPPNGSAVPGGLFPSTGPYTITLRTGEVTSEYVVATTTGPLYDLSSEPLGHPIGGEY
jgi:hypothetical protein